MADLQAIYDPDLEVGTIIDLDTNRPFGPIMVGPAAKDTLQAFLDGMPFDISILDSEQAAQVFEGWFQNILGPVLAEGTSDSPNTVVPVGDPSADEQALAQRESAVSGREPPAPQAADTDQQANTDTASAPVMPDPGKAATDGSTTETPVTPTVSDAINCGLCNPQGAGSTDPACIACGGSGKLVRVQ